LGSVIGEQAWVLASTVLAGVAVGLLYDVSRAGRQYLRPSRNVLFFLDLLFWILAALFVFLVLLAANRGEVRAYVFAGLSAGWVLYALIFSRICYRLMVGAASFLLSLWRAILAPFGRLYYFSRRLSARCKNVLLLPVAQSRRQVENLKDLFHKKKE
jgi:spore cortex biosynthesis protein YabQ